MLLFQVCMDFSIQQLKSGVRPIMNLSYLYIAADRYSWLEWKVKPLLILIETYIFMLLKALS